MNTQNSEAEDRMVLHPGDYRVTDRPATLSTLLGSCVAVCLYDPVRKAMGMNHFLLANRRNVKDAPVLASDAGRYGIHAMELLVNDLLALGAQRRYLRAKAFGGGNVLGHDCSESGTAMCVGTVNVHFVREFLSRDRIPLVAADLGGNYGRQIHFTGTDYSVYVRQIPTGQSTQVAAEEGRYLKRRLEAQEQTAHQTDFW